MSWWSQHQQVSSVDYFHKLQQRFGHTKDDDPKEASTEELRNLGRTLNEEYRQIVGGMNASGKMNQVEIKITAMQPDDTAIKDQLWAVKDLASKCRTVVYGLQMSPPSDKTERIRLQAESWLMQRRVALV